MKKRLNGVTALLMVLLTAVLISACSGSKKAAASIYDSKQITNAIDSSRWQFIAYQVSPQFGRVRQVNGLYNVSMRDNKLLVYLPYFGRATGGADIFSNRSPLDFTSAEFSPTVTKPSADEWRIAIKPQDNREVQLMNFTLFSTGSASLNVVMTNRSAISFTGRVEPAKR